VLAVDARDRNHSCDLTEVALIVTANNNPERLWDLAADVADNILDGNPHADQHGNADTWSFVRGASKAGSRGNASDMLIPPDSVRRQTGGREPRRRSQRSHRGAAAGGLVRRA